MIGRLPSWFLMVGIVTAPLGCDNVSWGGMTVRLEPPPSDTGGVPADSLLVEAGQERLEYGPLLFAGVREGDSAIVIPVAELVDGHLQPFPQGELGARMAHLILEERMKPGEALTVFHQGARIGTFTVSAPLGVTGEYCPPRPRAVGRVELLPSAREAGRFLALEEPLGKDWPFNTFQAMEASRAEVNGAQNLAGEALNQLRAPWPSALQDIRQDLQAFQLSGSSQPSVVATFLFQDVLGVGPAPREAYALMVIGEPDGTRFRRTFTWYRRVGEEGKGAPVFFSSMDWDRDGDDELLLEVFGSETRWWAGLDRSMGEWAVGSMDACGTPSGISTQGDGGGTPR